MPAAFTVGDIVLGRIWCDTGAGGGQASCNVLHYSVAAVGASPATDQDFVNNLDTLIASLVKPLIANTATYRGVQGQILNSNPPYAARQAAVFTIANSGVGTNGAVILPPQTAGIISLASAGAGPSSRGRTYLPFPSQLADSGVGVPSATYLTNAVLLSNIISSGLGVVAGGRTATLVRIILHRKNKAGVTPLPSPVTSAAVITKWATQRRRGDYGRQNRSPI